MNTKGKGAFEDVFKQQKAIIEEQVCKRKRNTVALAKHVIKSINALRVKNKSCYLVHPTEASKSLFRLKEGNDAFFTGRWILDRVMASISISQYVYFGLCQSLMKNIDIIELMELQNIISHHSKRYYSVHFSKSNSQPVEVECLIKSTLEKTAQAIFVNINTEWLQKAWERFIFWKFCVGFVPYVYVKPGRIETTYWLEDESQIYTDDKHVETQRRASSSGSGRQPSQRHRNYKQDTDLSNIIWHWVQKLKHCSKYVQQLDERRLIYIPKQAEVYACLHIETEKIFATHTTTGCALNVVQCSQPYADGFSFRFNSLMEKIKQDCLDALEMRKLNKYVSKANAVPTKVLLGPSKTTDKDGQQTNKSVDTFMHSLQKKDKFGKTSTELLRLLAQLNNKAAIGTVANGNESSELSAPVESNPLEETANDYDPQLQQTLFDLKHQNGATLSKVIQPLINLINFQAYELDSYKKTLVQQAGTNAGYEPNKDVRNVVNNLFDIVSLDTNEHRSYEAADENGYLAGEGKLTQEFNPMAGYVTGRIASNAMPDVEIISCEDKAGQIFQCALQAKDIDSEKYLLVANEAWQQCLQHNLAVDILYDATGHQSGVTLSTDTERHLLQTFFDLSLFSTSSIQEMFCLQSTKQDFEARHMSLFDYIYSKSHVAVIFGDYLYDLNTQGCESKMHSHKLTFEQQHPPDTTRCQGFKRKYSR